MQKFGIILFLDGGHMKFRGILFAVMTTLFLVLTFNLFPNDIVRKEVRVFGTFEDFVKNNPLKVYQTETEYNSDKRIKSNHGFIKVIEEKTADGRTIGTGFFIPPQHHYKYLRLNEYSFKQATTTKKMVATYDSLDNLFRRRALKTYKSQHCEAEAYNDTILIFKHKPNLIRVTYYYNQHSNHIYQSVYRIPKTLLDAYLQKMVSMGAIKPGQAEQLKRQADEHITLKYDFKNKYLDEAREQTIENKYNRQDLARTTNIDAATEPVQVKSYYLHRDAQGSTTAVTDQDGKLIERVTYGIYGAPTFWDYTQDPNNPVMRSHSVIGNDVLFQGRRYDQETGLYYFRNRYYDPIMGRFLSVDPLGYHDSMNLYQAFNNNPVNFSDPFGLAKVIIAAFSAVGGPHAATNTGARYEQTPTKAGSYVIGTKPFLYSNPYSRYSYSKIPWNAPMRVNKNQLVEFKIGQKWETFGKITKQDVEDALKYLLREIRRNQPPTMALPGYINFPSQWVLNDYGHATIAYFDDKNNNGIMDSGERLENDMIHPTPLGELQKALGIPNNQIYLEGSHGCIHVTPDDIDTMIYKGYLRKGSKIVIHSYKDDIPKNWKYDPTGRGPYEIHFFPGKKKMIILGEK